MDRLLHDMVCHGLNPALDLFGSQKICPLGIAAHAGQTKLREAAPKIPTARPRNLPSVQTHCSRAVFPASGFSPAERKWGRDYDTPQIAPFFLGSAKARG